MSSYQVQLQIVDENGKCQKIYPINTSLDTIVGLVEPSLLLKLPGEKEDETLATSLSYIKAYLANLENIAAVKRNISSSTNLDDASTIATSKAVYTVQSDLSDANTEIENIKNKYAIKNHAVETKDYGIGTSLLYGHVKLSDTYDSEVTNGKASNGLAASQYAVFKAYEYLTKKAQDIVDLQICPQHILCFTFFRIFVTFRSFQRALRNYIRSFQRVFKNSYSLFAVSSSG